jgi:WD40 repeat protein
VATTPGADRLVTSTAQVWELPALRPVRTLGCIIEGPLVVARDGEWIAYATAHRIDVWDVACDRLIKTLPAGEITVMTLAPDNDSLVVCGADGHVWIVSVASGECLRDFPAHEGVIRAVAVAPDGSWMVTGGADGTTGIWDWETAKPLRGLSGPSGVTAVTPESRWLAVGTGDGTAQIWDPESGRLLHRLRSEGPVTTMAAARNRSWLAVGSSQGEQGAIKIWNARTGRPVTMMRAGSPIRDCRWFDDDRGLLVFGTSGTQVFTLLQRP